jgi:hypothetical protein
MLPKGQTDSEFKKLENKLLSQINELNQITREINIGLNNTSPVFSTDLSRQHGKNSKTKQTPRDQYNYNLLKDGLHPGIHLSNVYLCICYARISSTRAFQEMLLYSVGNDSPFQ